MKSQKTICPMYIEKTCFFIKTIKFHICILQMHPMNQRLILVLCEAEIQYLQKPETLFA